MTTAMAEVPAEISQGLDFILWHLSNPEFPRTIMTSWLKQKHVYSKKEALTYYARSNFIDCRINAYYFSYLDFALSWIPNLIFIDLDLERFKYKLGLDSALEQTLANIKKHLQDETATPTVLWSGRGYHVIQPLDFPRALEYIPEFDRYDKPSENFLRFCKDFLSDGKADKGNYPSFRSCLLRIPNSINSKNGSKVQVMQKWNGKRQRIPKSLILEFLKYLRRNEIDQLIIRCSIEQNRKNNNNNSFDSTTKYYEWIDMLLETGIEDRRKEVIDLVLAPYLINIKKLSFEESKEILKDWLQKCDTVNKLDNSWNIKYRITKALQSAEKKRIGPMSRDKIKNDNTYEKVHILLVQKGILTKGEENESNEPK